MTEQHLVFEQTRRFYQNELEGKQHILLALHGYGQLAQYFYKKLSVLDKHWGIVVPEAPHRFYIEGSSGRVGASWMTKEWRAQDILENTLYLIQLIEQVRLAHPKAHIHLLGFSQGGATAARLYQTRPDLFGGLILWASVFPPDIAIHEFPKTCSLKFILGSEDPYFDAETSTKVIAEYENLGFEIQHFEGGHDIHSPTLSALFIA